LNLEETGTINYLTQLFNAILRAGCFPSQVAQKIMILKFHKDPVDVRSHKSISLLPIILKLFEKLLLQKLMPMTAEKRLISSYQFSFHNKDNTD
jgi:hypothetical protein